jgi:hypothetical protein
VEISWYFSNIFNFKLALEPKVPLRVPNNGLEAHALFLLGKFLESVLFDNRGSYYSETGYESE